MEKNTNTEVNQQQELAKYEPRYKSLIQVGKELQIVDNDTKKRAIELIRDLKLLSGQYKKLREYFLKPIKLHIKKVEGDIKPYEKAIEEVVGKDSYAGLRGRLANYETKIQEENRIAEEKLRKEQQKKYDREVAKAEKKDEIAPPPPPPVKVEAPKESGVSYRDDWTFDKENVEIEKVPEVLNGVRLKILDEKTVGKLIKTGVRKIPGIPIFCKKVPIIREGSLEDL